MLDIVPAAHDERAAAVRGQHRLLGVDDQVEQHLLHLMRVGEYLRKAGGERIDNRDVRDALIVRPQRERLADDVVQVDHGARGLTFASERQQVAHDSGGALRLAEDGLEAPPGLLVNLRGRPLRQPLGQGQDRRERVVQLVGDAGDRLAERGELFGLQQLVIQVARLVLELLALAHVAHQRVDSDRSILRRRIGMRGHFDPDR